MSDIIHKEHQQLVAQIKSNQSQDKSRETKIQPDNKSSTQIQRLESDTMKEQKSQMSGVNSQGGKSQVENKLLAQNKKYEQDIKQKDQTINYLKQYMTSTNKKIMQYQNVINQHENKTLSFKQSALKSQQKAQEVSKKLFERQAELTKIKKTQATLQKELEKQKKTRKQLELSVERFKKEIEKLKLEKQKSLKQLNLQKQKSNELTKKQSTNIAKVQKPNVSSTAQLQHKIKQLNATIQKLRQKDTNKIDDQSSLSPDGKSQRKSENFQDSSPKKSKENGKIQQSTNQKSNQKEKEINGQKTPLMDIKLENIIKSFEKDDKMKKMLMGSHMINKILNSKQIPGIKQKLKIILRSVCSLQLYFKQGFTNQLTKIIIQSRDSQEQLINKMINLQDLNENLLEQPQLQQKLEQQQKQQKHEQVLSFLDQSQISCISNNDKVGNNQGADFNNTLFSLNLDPQYYRQMSTKNKIKKMEEDLQQVSILLTQNKRAINTEDICENNQIISTLETLRRNSMAQIVIKLLRQNETIKKCLNQMMKRQEQQTEKNNDIFFEESQIQYGSQTEKSREQAQEKVQKKLQLNTNSITNAITNTLENIKSSVINKDKSLDKSVDKSSQKLKKTEKDKEKSREQQKIETTLNKSQNKQVSKEKIQEEQKPQGIMDQLETSFDQNMSRIVDKQNCSVM